MLSGFSGKSINLYSYAANNPVMLKDPLGRIIPYITFGGGIAGSILGGVANSATYLATRAITDNKITCGGM